MHLGFEEREGEQEENWTLTERPHPVSLLPRSG
jgi:hypothetical protein